jgi:hypothetical protein
VTRISLSQEVPEKPREAAENELISQEEIQTPLRSITEVAPPTQEQPE